MEKGNRDKQLIIVVDPMCSWCWGFAPVHRAIHQHYHDRAAISVLMGGLRTGSTSEMTQEFKEKILHHWHQVAAVTKQSFQFRFPDHFIYDTEPACRAAVVVRDIHSEKLLDYIELIQKRFYVENQDITHTDQLSDCATHLGIDADQFLSHFNSANMKTQTQKDFQLAFEYEATGFPTVLANYDGGFFPLAIGYDEFDNIKLKIDRWLSR